MSGEPLAGLVLIGAGVVVLAVVLGLGIWVAGLVVDALRDSWRRW